MPEIVSRLSGGETASEGAYPAAQSGNGSLGDFAKERLELAEWHLDGVQIWRVLRQISKYCAAGFDRLAHARDFMRGKAVHDHNVPTSEGGSQTGFDVCQSFRLLDRQSQMVRSCLGIVARPQT